MKRPVFTFFEYKIEINTTKTLFAKKWLVQNMIIIIFIAIRLHET